jgi:hypothetical protein
MLAKTSSEDIDPENYRPEAANAPINVKPRFWGAPGYGRFAQVMTVNLKLCWTVPAALVAVRVMV